MRLLRYKNGSTIIDIEHPSHSATINGKPPDEVLPFSEHHVKKYMGLDTKILIAQEHSFHQLQKQNRKG